MKIRYIIVFMFITAGFIQAKTFTPTQIVQKRDYKKLNNKANKYALKGEIEKSLNLAKEAFRIHQNKESLYIMARIYNFKKEYKSLKKVAKEILSISKNDYLGTIYLYNATKDKKILTSLLKEYPNDETILKKLKG